MVDREPADLLSLNSLPLATEISNPGSYKSEERFCPILLSMFDISDASRMVGSRSFHMQEVIKSFCSIDRP